MAAGLEKSSGNTGDPRNMMIVRKGSTAESSSVITLDQFKMIQYLPQIARDAKGGPIISADVVVHHQSAAPRWRRRGERHRCAASRPWAWHCVRR